MFKNFLVISTLPVSPNKLADLGSRHMKAERLTPLKIDTYKIK